jgi:lysophospholipase L1-like esterase
MNLLFAGLLLNFFSESSTPPSHVSFTWEMQERFSECIRLYNKDRQEYEPGVMDFSQGWVVRFRISGAYSDISDPEFVWVIRGVGSLQHYSRTYVTTKENLITSAPLKRRIGPPGNVKPADVHKKIQPEENRPPDSPPPSNAWLVVEKLPLIGSYQVQLTVRSRTKLVSAGYSHTQNVTLRNIVIACLGDSYASGEGNPDQDGIAGSSDRAYCNNITAVQVAEGSKSDFVELRQEAQWFEKLAHRSMRSGYALAARTIEEMDPHSVVTFINLSISGAKIQQGLLQQQEDRPWMRKGQLGYLEELVKENKIDYVLLSIGGNDVGFSNILTEATLGTIDLVNINDYLRRIESLRVSYHALDLYMKSRLNIGKVLIGEYPTQLFSNNLTPPIINTNQYSCELFQTPTGYLSIEYDEIINLNKIGEALQKLRMSVAAELGWLYAGDIAEAFKGHGYCSTPEETYWITATYSCNNQGDTRGTMHPNAKGHELIRRSVVKEITKNLLPIINFKGWQVKTF